MTGRIVRMRLSPNELVEWNAIREKRHAQRPWHPPLLWPFISLSLSSFAFGFATAVLLMKVFQ